MTLTEMTKSANSYTDENFSATQCLPFVNEAIGSINAELDCELPFINDVNTDYLALSETWIRQLLIPYIAYSIKMNDGSLNEASVFLNSYNQGMQRISDKKYSAIPVAYQTSGFEKVYQIDYVTGLASTYGIGAKPYTIADYDEYKYYYIGEYCYYGGNVYICIRDSQGNLPTSTTYFRVYVQ
jgi:hypothetical protein